jgi:hypothetical protein
VDTPQLLVAFCLCRAERMALLCRVIAVVCDWVSARDERFGEGDGRGWQSVCMCGASELSDYTQAGWVNSGWLYEGVSVQNGRTERDAGGWRAKICQL